MYRWQVVGHEYYTEVAQSQYLVDQRLPTSRGVIYAADGTVLAVDEPVWGVYASVSSDERERETFDENRDEYISKVSEILGLEVDDLEKNLTEDFRYVLLKHNVSADDKKSLEQTNLFG
ncbi:MAG: hypothetical protein U9Q67_02300, partial [Patescibacteria group bacterium]|nr:hypothetical protein [Patescibacteria group bacterium]